MFKCWFGTIHSHEIFFLTNVATIVNNGFILLFFYFDFLINLVELTTMTLTQILCILQYIYYLFPVGTIDLMRLESNGEKYKRIRNAREILLLRRA